MGTSARALLLCVLQLGSTSQLLNTLALVASLAPTSSALRPWGHVREVPFPSQAGLVDGSEETGTGSHVSSLSAMQAAPSHHQPSQASQVTTPLGSGASRARFRTDKATVYGQPGLTTHNPQRAQPERQLLQVPPQPAQPPASPDASSVQGQDASCLVTVTFGVSDGRAVGDVAANTTLLGSMAIEPAARPAQVRTLLGHIFAAKVWCYCLQTCRLPLCSQIQLSDWVLTWRFTAGEAIRNTSTFRARGEYCATSKRVHHTWHRH
jgi:hypothetical protein